MCFAICDTWSAVFSRGTFGRHFWNFCNCIRKFIEGCRKLSFISSKRIVQIIHRLLQHVSSAETQTATIIAWFCEKSSVKSSPVDCQFKLPILIYVFSMWPTTFQRNVFFLSAAKLYWKTSKKYKSEYGDRKKTWYILN